MKLGRKILVTLNFLLLPVIGILGNVLAANFPVLLLPALWLGGAGIIVIFAIVNIALALSEAKQNEISLLQQPH